jgi:hypothetical protein
MKTYLECVYFPLDFTLASGETNTIIYLVIKKILFYDTGLTKKLSLKHRFCAAVFTCFLN